nr:MULTISPECIES: hypothetical protein [Cyanophyceae]
MQATFFTTVLLPVGLAIVMLGMGLTLLRDLNGNRILVWSVV